jgi:rhodanese-related sulfurtransferase
MPACLWAISVLMMGRVTPIDVQMRRAYEREHIGESANANVEDAWAFLQKEFNIVIGF